VNLQGSWVESPELLSSNLLVPGVLDAQLGNLVKQPIFPRVDPLLKQAAPSLAARALRIEAADAELLLKVFNGDFLNVAFS
jgi:hypothetical protein